MSNSNPHPKPGQASSKGGLDRTMSEADFMRLAAKAENETTATQLITEASALFEKSPDYMRWNVVQWHRTNDHTLVDRVRELYQPEEHAKILKQQAARKAASAPAKA